MKDFGTRKFWRLYSSEKMVSPIDRQDGQKKRPDVSQCSIPVRTAQRTKTIENSCSHKCLNGPADANHKDCSIRCSDTNTKTVNKGSVLCNRLDVLQQILKIATIRPDTAYGNSSLCQTRFFEAYLKGLLGCVYLGEFSVEFQCAKRKTVRHKRFMYLS
jgi:hypothetical protein